MNVPHLRFKDVDGREFPKWAATLIGEISEVTTGGKDTQNKVDDGLYPFFVRSQTVERINSYSFDGEAILTSGDGVGVGKNFHYINGKFDFHQRVYCIHSFKNQINGKFVFHCFTEKFNKRVMQLSAKNSVDSVRRSMITDMPISTPCLEEQTKIANFLTAVDEKIAHLTQKHTLLTQYKKGVMQQIFSQQLRFKDDDGRDFPEWVKVCLGDVAKITTGSSNRIDSTVGSGAYTFFDRSQDIRTSDIYLFDCEAVIVAGEGQEFFPKHFIGKFDLHQRTYAIMSFDNFDGKYLYFYVYKHSGYFLSQAVGSTVKSLRLPMFQKMPIYQPCLREQTKIANFLTAIDDKLTTVHTQLHAMKQYKQGLLQQMFV
jgi:type I restriction enzyme S subunit